MNVKRFTGCHPCIGIFCSEVNTMGKITKKVAKKLIKKAAKHAAKKAAKKTAKALRAKV